MNPAAIPIIPLTEALAAWVQRLANRGKAPGTVTAYACDLRSALQSFERRDLTVVAVVSAAAVEGWLDDLAAKRNVPRSQARKLAAATRFFEYCLQQRWCTHNPCAGIRISYRAERVIAPELSVLLNVINRIPKSSQHWRDVRDRAFLRLALDSALRTGGLMALNVPADREPHTIDLQRLTVSTVRKGGGTSHPVAINQRTADCVQRWLDVRHQVAMPFENALFVTRTGRRLTRADALHITRTRGRAAGVQGLHIHLFRHRRAGDLIERVGLKVASNHLGHAHESTTANTYGAHLGSHNRAVVRRDADIDQMGAA